MNIPMGGGAIDPDVAARELRGSGHQRFTVFILRTGQRKRAVVARRSRGR